MVPNQPIEALTFLLLGPAVVQATDWPQWRGPNRDGVWAETGIVQTIPAEGLRIRWRVPVGPGWSSRWWSRAGFT